MKISVIVPCYNVAPWLGRCLDSILAQSHEELEIIAVDDGSTDKTAEITDAYAAKDGRITAVHQKNGGVTSARLAGFRKATGEYIGFVDGDDCVEPDMFERLLKNAVEYSADISHCGYRMIFPGGRTDFYYNTGKTVLQDRTKGIKDLLEGVFVEPGLCNKLYKRELLEKLIADGTMDKEIRINEDLLMNYYLFKCACFSVYEDFCQYNYMLRKGSASKSKRQRFGITDPVKVQDIILEDAKNEPEIYGLAFRRQIRALIFAAQQTDWPDEAEKARRKIKKQLKEKGEKVKLSPKLYFMALGAAYMSPIYRLIRKIYDKITGTDKKYDLD